MAKLKLTTLMLATAGLVTAAPVFAGSESNSGAQQGQPPASQTPAEKMHQNRHIDGSMPSTMGRSTSTIPGSGGQTPTGGPSGGVPGRS